MKKNLIRLMACIMAFALVLSLTACGGKDDAKGSDSSSKTSTASKVESSEASSEASSSAASTSGEKYASIDEFLADPTVSSTLESMMSSLDDSMKIDIAGKGDTLVYTFTFAEDVGDVEAFKAAMEEQMNEESFASTFRGIAASLKEAIEVTNPSVIVTYLNADGSEIYSQEYFPE